MRIMTIRRYLPIALSPEDGQSVATYIAATKATAEQLGRAIILMRHLGENAEADVIEAYRADKFGEER